MAQLPRAVRPFATGQYRLLFGALTLSLFGGGMWLVALVWQVIELGGGPLQLSITATATSIGMVGATLIGGVVADRVPQRLILVGIESVKLLSMSAVAALAVAGSLELWHLVVAAALLGWQVWTIDPAQPENPKTRFYSNHYVGIALSLAFLADWVW